MRTHAVLKDIFTFLVQWQVWGQNKGNMMLIICDCIDRTLADIKTSVAKNVFDGGFVVQTNPDTTKSWEF